jgi:hypothetical protein
MGIISQKLRDSAKGETCTFQIAGICNGNPETTVLCHLPSDVKGMGNKSPDFIAAFGCFACHEAIDQRRLSVDDWLFYCLRAMQRTWSRWIERGLVIIPVDPGTAKRRPRNRSGMKSAPMPGTKASGVKRSFDGKVSRR